MTDAEVREVSHLTADALAPLISIYFASALRKLENVEIKKFMGIHSPFERSNATEY